MMSHTGVGSFESSLGQNGLMLMQIDSIRFIIKDWSFLLNSSPLSDKTSHRKLLRDVDLIEDTRYGCGCVINLSFDLMIALEPLSLSTKFV